MLAHAQENVRRSAKQLVVEPVLLIRSSRLPQRCGWECENRTAAQQVPSERTTRTRRICWIKRDPVWSCEHSTTRPTRDVFVHVGCFRALATDRGRAVRAWRGALLRTPKTQSLRAGEETRLQTNYNVPRITRVSDVHRAITSSIRLADIHVNMVAGWQCNCGHLGLHVRVWPTSCTGVVVRYHRRVDIAAVCCIGWRGVVVWEGVAVSLRCVLPCHGRSGRGLHVRKPSVRGRGGGGGSSVQWVSDREPWCAQDMGGANHHATTCWWGRCKAVVGLAQLEQPDLSLHVLQMSRGSSSGGVVGHVRDSSSGRRDGT